MPISSFHSMVIHHEHCLEWKKTKSCIWLGVSAYFTTLLEMHPRSSSWLELSARWRLPKDCLPGAIIMLALPVEALLRMSEFVALANSLQVQGANSCRHKTICAPEINCLAANGQAFCLSKYLAGVRTQEMFYTNLCQVYKSLKPTCKWLGKQIVCRSLLQDNSSAGIKVPCYIICGFDEMILYVSLYPRVS